MRQIRKYFSLKVVIGWQRDYYGCRLDKIIKQAHLSLCRLCSMFQQLMILSFFLKWKGQSYFWGAIFCFLIQRWVGSRWVETCRLMSTDDESICSIHYRKGNEKSVCKERNRFHLLWLWLGRCVMSLVDEMIYRLCRFYEKVLFFDDVPRKGSIQLHLPLRNK